MAFDFPTPTFVGQQFTPIAGGNSYVWNGQAWDMASAGVIPGTMVEIARRVANNSASIDFISLMDGTYDEYEVHYWDVLPALTNNGLVLQVGQGGVIQTAANYWYALNTAVGVATPANSPAGSSTSSGIPITHPNNATNSAGFVLNGRVTIARPATSGAFKNISFSSGSINITPAYVATYGAGAWAGNLDPIDSLRFIVSGNILTGTFVLYGISRSPVAPITPVGGRVLIDSKTVSAAVATVDFTTGINATYDEYEFDFYGVKGVADGSINIQISSDNGASWKTDANYCAGWHYVGIVGTPGDYQATTNTAANITNLTLSATGSPGAAGLIKLQRPYLSLTHLIGINCTSHNSTLGYNSSIGVVGHNSVHTISGVRFLSSGGNIAQGTFNLYGIKK